MVNSCKLLLLTFLTDYDQRLGMNSVSKAYFMYNISFILIKVKFIRAKEQIFLNTFLFFIYSPK